jgi:hypothetical protein
VGAVGLGGSHVGQAPSQAGRERHAQPLKSIDIVPDCTVARLQGRLTGRAAYNLATHIRTEPVRH